MIVSSTHQKIDALREILPDGFVFVLDTTDRSFIYKSSENPYSEQFVVSFDKEHGIDSRVKTQDLYTFQNKVRVAKLQKIGMNTFLGVCVLKSSQSEKRLSMADTYISN